MKQVLVVAVVDVPALDGEDPTAEAQRALHEAFPWLVSAVVEVPREWPRLAERDFEMRYVSPSVAAIFNRRKP